VGKPSEFLRDQMSKAAEASSAGDGEAVRQHLDHAVAEDPDALGHIIAEIDRW